MGENWRELERMGENWRELTEMIFTEMNDQSYDVVNQHGFI